MTVATASPQQGLHCRWQSGGPGGRAAGLWFVRA